MDLWTLGQLAAGMVVLIIGAELLVRGASRLALSFGLSPLVVGLTVVAYGTSSPELAVSLQSTLDGRADIAVGNVVGSNIFNVLFILGISALITPLVVAKKLIRVDVPVMIVISALVLVMGLDGSIGMLEGIILVVGVFAYTGWLILESRRERIAANASADDQVKRSPAWRNILLALAGLGLLVWGAQWLVDGAVTLARTLGVSDLIIGLTIVAAGTSLPEVATSIVASIRGERDIAVGNVVGSNIFNILAVLGASAVIAPGGIPISPAVVRFDFPIMLGVALACLPVFFHEGSINRWEGGMFLGYYIAYTAYLIFAATQHDLLPAFSAIMLWFVIPITVVTLAVVSIRFARRPQTVQHS